MNESHHHRVPTEQRHARTAYAYTHSMPMIDGTREVVHAYEEGIKIKNESLGLGRAEHSQPTTDDAMDGCGCVDARETVTRGRR